MVDFVGIGAPRAGTTWLYGNLRWHPQIWFPFIKELHYFDSVHLTPGRTRAGRLRIKVKKKLGANRKSKSANRLDNRAYFKRIRSPDYMYTDEWYYDIFSPAPPDSKSGEITPAYCAIGEQGIAHMKRMLPNVQLIYNVRDPLSQFISGFGLWARKPRRAKRTPAEVLDDLFFAKGDYRRNIPLWDAAYGAQIYYLPFGQIKTDPTSVLRRIEARLGLEPFDGYPTVSEHVTGSSKVEIEPAIMARLEEAAEPQRRYLIERFGEEFVAAIK